MVVSEIMVDPQVTMLVYLQSHGYPWLGWCKGYPHDLGFTYMFFSEEPPRCDVLLVYKPITIWLFNIAMGNHHF